MLFSRLVIEWYNRYKRDLPWRHTIDAYKIWLAEVILQQTRVDQGMPYYFRFLEKYPTVRDFAAAAEDDILRLWQGLGYYSRGRNMLATARQVVDEHKGIFPHKHSDLIKLKGIGPYTAAAISSFSANEPHAVIDGNVYRVIARYFGVASPSDTAEGKKQVAHFANEILDRNNAGLHNQAMIEFGALLCKPRNPDCGNCPVSSTCYAFHSRKTGVLPTRKTKRALRHRYFNYALFINKNSILLSRRDNFDIWAGLYQPFLIETESAKSVNELLLLPEIRAIDLSKSVLRKNELSFAHLLTHQKIHLRFIVFDLVGTQLPAVPHYEPVKMAQLKNIAFPQPVLNAFKTIFNL